MPLPRSPGRLSLRRLAPRQREERITVRRRAAMIGIGLLLVLYGVAKLNLEPGGMYSNYWGGVVYAPFVILAGVIAIIGAFIQKADTAALKPGDKPVEFP